MPLASSLATGQAENWAGTAGQAACATDTGSHYNYPGFDGSTTGTVRCAFVPSASSGITLNPAMTVCSYTFPNYATGWRWHTWTSADCSHGLPMVGSASIGWAQNNAGTEGQASCATDKGGHYNHPTWGGSTTGTVTCTFLAPGSVGAAEATICSYGWSDYATGWRWHPWVPNDCSHGLPATGSWAVGQGENGNGTAGQAQCVDDQGGHYNHPTQSGATSGTVRCLYVRRPSPTTSVSFTEDLNGDGVSDSTLSLVSCGNLTCLRVESALFSSLRDIPLQPEAKDPWAIGKQGVIMGLKSVRAIGDHTGDGLSEVSVLYVRERAIDTAPYYSPALAVIDVDAQSILADAASPVGVPSAQYSYALQGYAAFLQDPAGKTHPALVPGYGDGNADASKTWGYGCAFKLGSSSSHCGSGYVELETAGPVPPPPVGGGTWFREVGGFLADLDNDGWDDLSLIYHYGIVSFSGQTGTKLGTTSFDVTAGMSPIGFDSGRRYGVFSTFKENNTIYTTMIGGNPVGSFTDYYCTVSRWQGVLSMPLGNVGARTLVWSNFRGFHSNNWTSFPFVPAGGAAPTPARSGDFADGCIHRFADGQSIMDGEKVLITNQFTADYSATDNAALAGKCKDVQYQLYLDPSWTSEKVSAWETCAAQHLGARGRWGMSVKRVSDGAGLTGSLDSYVWGWSTQLRPGSDVLYLVESMPNKVRFDATDSSQGPMLVRALVNGSWQERGVMPVSGRPVMTAMKAKGIGTGDYNEVRTFVTADRDGDGLSEIKIRLLDGNEVWVGWQVASSTFVVKQ